MAQSYIKDPTAVLDYWMDWGAWLVPGESLLTSTWTTTGTPVLSLPAILGSLTQVWVSGGTRGEALTLSNRVTSSEGREDERSLSLLILER